MPTDDSTEISPHTRWESAKLFAATLVQVLALAVCLEGVRRLYWFESNSTALAAVVVAVGLTGFLAAAYLQRQLGDPYGY